MTDVVGNPEEERHAEFFFEPWSQEAVSRYFYGKVGGFEKEGSKLVAYVCPNFLYFSLRNKRGFTIVCYKGISNIMRAFLKV